MTLGDHQRRAHLIQGHALDVLRALPAESVHCIVTSPPYWGLRDYGLEPQEWGGRAGCKHEWGAEIVSCPQTGGSESSGLGKYDNGLSAEMIRQKIEAQKHGPSVSSTCVSCGAWRGSLGLEPAVGLYVAHLVEVFEEARRVLRKDGTLWLNLGDSYAHGGNGSRDAERWPKQSRNNDGDRIRHAKKADASLKPKDLVGVPWRVASALQEAGWWLRSDCIWSKPNPMPESVTDRPTRAHEYVFLLTKAERYFYDSDAVREPLSTAMLATPYKLAFKEERPDVGFPQASAGKARGRRGAARKTDALEGGHGTMGHDGNGMRMLEKWNNPAGRNLRSVWTFATTPYAEAHFATFPPELAERCIRAGTSQKGCCPTCGAPLQRMVDVAGETTQERARRNGHADHAQAYGASKQNLDFKGSHWKLPGRDRQTAGWRYACHCLRKRIESAGIAWPITPEQASALAPQFDDLAPTPCTVLDPFGGAGTVALVALRLGRQAVSIELNPAYVEMQKRRIQGDAPLLNDVVVSTPTEATP